MSWRDSISRPITPQAETIPLDQVARGQFLNRFSSHEKCTPC
jgi:hypothetical protein